MVKTIIYAGDRIITGDDIAAAVLRCGKALAESSSAETVDIPFVDANNTLRRATLLLGPASQIIVEHGPTGLEELIDADVVAALDRVVAGRAAVAHDPDESVATAWTDDL